jgi:hypothetical protein
MGGFSRYQKYGHHRVDGYAQTPVFGLLHAIDALQRRHGIAGSVAEIGVHHGQLFIGMALLQTPDEQSVAIDLFDDQDLNIDQSGCGDLGHFRRNVAHWAPEADVVIHQGDSTQLKHGDVAALARVRMFSVDGGHTADIVRSDMELAEQCLVDGGVVIADDVFNEQWPDVCVGTLAYLRDEPELVPFAVGFNKTLFTQHVHAARYRAALCQHYSDRFLTVPLEGKTFDGHQMVALVNVPRTPAHLARRSETVRRAVHALRH